jgi:transketolase
VCGVLLKEALQAADALLDKGIEAEVIEFLTLKPFDSETLIASAEKTGRIVTIEEHSVIGGLGGAVSECVSESFPVPVRKVGLKDTFAGSGDYNTLLTEYEMTAEDIIKAVQKIDNNAVQKVQRA